MKAIRHLDFLQNWEKKAKRGWVKKKVQLLTPRLPLVLTHC